jgi:phosphoribosylglycinamide formyltransferase-1
MKTTPKKLSVGVLASGSGTDLQSIIDASEKKMIDAEIVVVISDKKDAFVLDRAKTHHIPGFFVDPKGKSRTAHEDEIDTVLRNHQVELIVGAGYMRLLSPSFIKKWHHKIINIHPALLPSFKGTEGIKDAFEYGVKVTGVTVHFVDEKMDHGPIILQQEVEIAEDDTLETLEKKIHGVEHRLYPEAVRLYVEGKLKLELEGRKVKVSNR